MLIREEDKRVAVDDYYDNISARLNFDFLGLPTLDLSSINFCFSEAKLWNTNRDMPSDKSPGSDGFTGLYYKMAWPIIKHDSQWI